MAKKIPPPQKKTIKLYWCMEQDKRFEREGQWTYFIENK